MADAAHDWTEDEIKKLEARIAKAYSDAYAEAVNLNQDFLKDFDKKLKEWRETVKKDPGKQKAFKSWLNEQLFKREFRHDLVEQLARDLVETERGAAAIINDELPIIFAQNANYAMYTIENQAKMAINFQLVDQDTVRRLLRDQPDVLPLVSPDGKKAMKWNTEKVRNAVTQSILLGESIPNMAKRLQGVYKMGERMATMAARTAATGAENGGRVESYKRAEKMGIELEQEWVATLDDRTRDSHRMLDGEKVKVGEKFSNGLRFPGDPHGAPEEIYNCRCSLVAALKGVDLSDAKRHADFKEGQTYEEWKKGKQAAYSRDINDDFTNEKNTTSEPPKSSIFTPSVINENAEVYKNISDNTKKKVDEMLSSADNLVSDIWRKYEPNLVLEDATSPESYFDPLSGVHLNENNLIKSDLGPMTTWFHEFGHNIDFTAGSEKQKKLAYIANNKKFKKAIESDVTNAINGYENKITANYDQFKNYLDKEEYKEAINLLGSFDMNSYNKESYLGTLTKLREDDKNIMNQWAFDEMVEDLKNVKGPSKAVLHDMFENEVKGIDYTARAALSDLIEGATKGEYKCGAGHGKFYWEEEERHLPCEAFAEFFSAECVYSESPQILDTLKEWMPISYNEFRGILKEASSLL